MQHYIDRVLNINWKNIGSNKDKDLSLLAYEFIRRMAKFIYDNNFKSISMLRFCSVVAYLTNDFSKIDSKSFFDKYATQSMKENNSISYDKYFLGHYFQLIDYATENPSAEKYLEIYEPLIKLWEVGGDIAPDHHGNLTVNGFVQFQLKTFFYVTICPKKIFLSFINNS